MAENTEEARLGFRKFLKELADDIPEEELDALKRLMTGKKGYGRAILQRITTVLGFFERLETSGDLSACKTDYLKELLKGINREDLCNKVEEFKKTNQITERNDEIQSSGKPKEEQSGCQAATGGNESITERKEEIQSSGKPKEEQSGSQAATRGNESITERKGKIQSSGKPKEEQSGSQAATGGNEAVTERKDEVQTSAKQKEEQSGNQAATGGNEAIEREFQLTLLYLANHLQESDLRKMKMFLNIQLGEGRLEPCTCAEDIFKLMQNHGLISAGHVKKLLELLHDIERIDMYKYLKDKQQ